VIKLRNRSICPTSEAFERISSWFEIQTLITGIAAVVLVIRLLETKIQILFLSHAYCHFRPLFAEFLVPGDDGILTWRQSRDFVGAIARANCKKRMVKNGDVGFFPWVLVAPYRKK